MSETAEASELLEAVRGLRDTVQSAKLPLEVAEVEQARRARDEMLHQFDDYILPRLTNLDAPLLTVVGGSTGAGKSTLVNTLAQRVVSRSGVLRPTTRACVLVHHEDDARWFTTPRVLPGLTRVSGNEADDPSALRLAQADGLPPGIALLDAPDIDSVVESNRDLARQLLGAADLWLFVTTAARYADAVPWQMLRQAVERGTSVAIVLDRVPEGASEEIAEHLGGMLVDEGLTHSPVFTLTETQLLDTGLLPESHVTDLRDWLSNLGEDARARGLLVRRTLGGALDSLSRRVELLAEASSTQVQTVEQLHAVNDVAWRDAIDRVAVGMSDGTLLRGEVLARWQEYVGTGEFLRQLEVGFGRFRDRVAAALRGRPAPTTELGEALQSGVADLIIANAGDASLEVNRRWKAVSGGDHLVQSHPELASLRPGFEDDAHRLVRDWQEELLQLVRSEGGDRRTTARVLSMGVNAVGVVLMLVVFSHTMGSLGGAEVGIAGGSAVVAQRLLEAVFGDQAVRTLAEKARRRLIELVTELYDSERARAREAVDEIQIDVEQPRDLLAAAEAVRMQR
ncbi:GTPase family protein [Gephyromycinifex aptenodytis]|uniref:ABC transporter n=1 Tax=Gephyromycinifex aptenodytis TaxID=2716227 RepID=UPI0014470FF8|nr:ABC transporter [Gephyromycinifex aptenodytis]